MLKTWMLVASSLGFLLMAVMAADSIAQPKTAKNEALRQELLRRMRNEQEAGKAFGALLKKTLGIDKEQRAMMVHPALRRLMETDRQNTVRMIEIVKQHGWPGKSLVGADGASAASFLVQHAGLNRPFQKQCLSLLAEAVKTGEATGEQLAYLTDLIRVAEKQKQVYGMQLRLVDGKLQPYPIEDEANVDKRRQAVGLSPLADYLKSAEKAFKASGKSKP